MKQKIIGNALIFIFMLCFIVGFSAIFGSDNLLVGVSTITAVLMFLQKDFSLNPFKTAIKLICFNIAMGLVTFVAGQNAIIGVPLNFIFVFFMGYTLSYNLSTPSFVPFNLQYVFMLGAPVTIDKLPMRLLALTVGAIMIVLSQVLFNKNKIYKQGNSVLSNICLDIIKKLDAIEKNQSIEELEKQIKAGMQNFRRMVYNRREQGFYLTDESRIKLNISFELEKINNVINELVKEKDSLLILQDDDFKKDFESAINTIKMCLDKDENLTKIDELFNGIFHKYNENKKIDVFKLRILNSLLTIKKSLDELKNLDKKKYNLISKLEEIPSNFKLKTIYKENFNSNSLKFSYAIKLALGITISGFIATYFNLEQGRWIVYTVNSLIQPFYEKSQSKTRDRLMATLVGVIIVSIGFYFIKNSTDRTLFMLGMGYIFSFFPEYKYRTINTTISAIGGAALNGGAVVITTDRITFVVLGTIIALLITRFVFPYRAENAKKYLIKLYNDTIVSQINIIKNLIDKNKIADEAMRNEVLRANMIEERLLSNQSIEDKKLNKYLNEQRVISNDISDLYNLIKEDNINIKLDDHEKAKIDRLVHDKNNIEYDKIGEFINNPKSNYSLSSKIAIIDYMQILINVNKVKKIKGLV